MTVDEIIVNAVRLLQAAEFETDRALMEQYRLLADTWIAVGQLVLENSHT